MKLNSFNNPDFIKRYLIDKNIKPTSRKVNEYSKVLNALNDLMLDSIILENYTLILGDAIRLKLVKRQRNFDKLAVNWGASNKLKKEILDRGGKPAKKIGTSDNGNPIFDGGERWMVFFTDDDYVVLKKLYIFNHEKKLKVPSAFYWKFRISSKAEERINHYINSGKINKVDIPLYERNKNNFI